MINGSLSGIGGENGWFISAVELSASVTEAGSGLSPFETSLDGVNWTAYSAPLTFNDGSYTVQLRASDLAGNVETISQAVNIDSVTPLLSKTITGTSGTNGWYTSSVSVDASASDAAPSSGITFSFSTDGSTWSPYTASFSLNEGEYDLQFLVKDTAGNQVSSADAIKVDSTAPTVDGTLSGTLGSGGWYTSPVKATATAADATSGIALIEYSIDGGASWATYSAPLDFKDGSHSLLFRTTDLAGLSATSASYSFKADASGPHISLPQSWYIWDSVTFRTEEETSGFTGIEMVIRDKAGRWKKVTESWTTDQSTFAHTINWDRRFSDGILAPIGSYEVVVTAWDAAGNESRKTGEIIIPDPGAAALPLIASDPQPEIAAAVVEPLAPVVEPPPVVVEAPPEPQPAEIKEKKGIVVPFGSQTKSTAAPSNTQAPDPNILWGATASAAIAAFAAQIAERKRQEEEARKRAASAKAQRYKAIARAYQASLNAFKDGLVQSGVKVVDAIKQRTEALKKGKIPSSVAAVVSNFKAEQDQRKTKRARVSILDDPPPKYAPEEIKRIKEAVAEIDAEKKIGYKDPELSSSIILYTPGSLIETIPRLPTVVVPSSPKYPYTGSWYDLESHSWQVNDNNKGDVPLVPGVLSMQDDFNWDLFRTAGGVFPQPEPPVYDRAEDLLDLVEVRKTVGTFDTELDSDFKKTVLGVTMGASFVDDVAHGMSNAPFTYKSIILKIPNALGGNFNIYEFTFLRSISSGDVRTIGRALGENLGGPSIFLAGWTLTVTPNIIENDITNAPMNEILYELGVDTMGFGVSEGAGDIVQIGGAGAVSPWVSVPLGLVVDGGVGYYWDRLWYRD